MTTLVGKSFKAGDVQFTIRKDRFWAEGSHGPKDPNGPRLDALQPGYLMSVTYQGHPTPFIRVKGGVVKPERIEVEGQKIDGARRISEKLGIGTKYLPRPYEKA